MISESQFGFQRGPSTTNALHNLMDLINTALKKGIFPLTIFVNLRKEFDTVDFKVLLNRMSALGIRSTQLEWFKSYLY